MRARLILRSREVLGDGRFVERVVWSVPRPVAGSGHGFKYRLAFVVQGVCVVRFDNEAGKGDHKHVNGVESAYAFEDLRKLLADFWHEVDAWMPR